MILKNAFNLKCPKVPIICEAESLSKCYEWHWIFAFGGYVINMKNDKLEGWLVVEYKRKLALSSVAVSFKWLHRIQAGDNCWFWAYARGLMKQKYIVHNLCILFFKVCGRWTSFSALPFHCAWKLFGSIFNSCMSKFVLQSFPSLHICYLLCIVLVHSSELLKLYVLYLTKT